MSSSSVPPYYYNTNNTNENHNIMNGTTTDHHNENNEGINMTSLPPRPPSRPSSRAEVYGTRIIQPDDHRDDQHYSMINGARSNTAHNISNYPSSSTLNSNGITHHSSNMKRDDISDSDLLSTMN